MKKLNLCLALALCMTAFAACSDSNPTNPGNGGGDTYQPMTKNSTWSYTGMNTYTQTISGDTTIAGKVYAKVTNSLSPGFGLIWRDGTSYYSSATSAPDNAILYLKDEPVGTAWTFNLTINGTTNKYECTLVERGITRTVNGKEYKDVIHVNQKTYVEVQGMSMLFNDGHYYYAKGVGLIESDFGAGRKITLANYTIQ